jgi:DNA primase catalytic core
MARIPQQEIDRLKEEVSVQRLVEDSGVALRKAGKDLMGRCKFHADDQASLVVSPKKNLWNCFGCGIGGGAIDWVMKDRGLSFRQAVEVLQAEVGSGVKTQTTAQPAAAAPSSLAAAAVVVDTAPDSAQSAADQTLLAQTIDYYHQRLKDTAGQAGSAVAYLASRGLTHPGLVDAFRLGVGDRSLGLLVGEGWPLPAGQFSRKTINATRASLQRLGLLRQTGHEHFNGSLVVPLFDEAGVSGNVVEVYGRKLRDDLRQDNTQYGSKHLYLRNTHEDVDAKRYRGVFNLAGVQAAGQHHNVDALPGCNRGEVILCEALIDAMTFWCAGFRQVTSSFGAGGFTDDILQAFKVNGIERVFIAYDRDEAGDRGAQSVAPLLIAEGFEVLRVVFPKGMDANEYAQKMHPADKALALVLRQAVWIGGVRKIEQQPAAEKKISPADEEVQAAAVDGALEASSLAAAPLAAPQALDGVQAQSQGMQALPVDQPDELHIDTGGITWRVRGWKKNTSAEQMKVNLQARRKPEPGAHENSTLGAYFVDTLDLYAARSRGSFLRASSVELGMGEEAVKRELGAVLLKLETLQDELLAQGREQRGNNTARAPILSADDERAALELLRMPNLMQRVVDDLHALGVVGEDMNLMAAYLAAVSRKLDAPLAVLIQSSSAAGKSSLMDAVLQLIPEEERIRYSAMTGQSLFYLGETNVQHKILAIAEEEGVRQAAYALKLLQSDGELTIASTAKDEATGDLRTRQYTVKGPVMLMLTTTAIDVDEELMNRCLVLAVNESREQTAAIHARQRHKQTLEGLLQSSQRAAIENLHHNAQRLLASVAVVNPYADQLTFLADKTRTRRDHMKYLTLIRSIALLHQHQREVKEVAHGGQTLRYIEVTRSDIELANQIAHEVLGRTLDELPPQTRRLLQLTRAMVHARAQAQQMRPRDVRFTRKDIRDATQWSDNQLKVHCARLADMEYMLIHGGNRGHSLRYELLWDGGDEAASSAQRRHLCGLLDPAELEKSSGTDATTDSISDYDGSAIDSAQNQPVRQAQVGVQRAQVGAKLAPSCLQVGVKLDLVNQPLSHASIDDEPDSHINGAKTHRYCELSKSQVVVVPAQ